MGYHAPKANEVYDYIFRRGRHAPTSLNDGFGWSILFVNDTSPFCREFLVKYGAELCYRTSDRIRFVFFSGLSESETERLAMEANGEWGNTRRKGFLRRVVEKLRRMPDRDFDLEREFWDELRPTALHPLDSPATIDRHLDMECEIYSAMPGAREALKLATDLKIGRFVPCFLLFSDTQQPNVWLYPVAHQSPSEVFDQLRRWIDQFYETNSTGLNDWSRLERDVAETTRRFRGSARSLNQWKEGRRQLWGSLNLLSALNHRLSLAEDPGLILKLVAEAKDIPSRIRDFGRSYELQLQTAQRRAEAIDRARRLAKRLVSELDETNRTARLEEFINSQADWIPSNVREALTSVIDSDRPPSKSVAPNFELRQWWRSDVGRMPSKNKFRKYRQSWANYSKAIHGTAAEGASGEIIEAEFQVLTDAVLQLPLFSDPTESTKIVLEAMRAHLRAANDSAWQVASASARKVIEKYLSDLQAQSPRWLLAKSKDLVPPLLIKECLPTAAHLQATGLRDCVHHLPRLEALANEAEENHASVLSEIESTFRQQQQAAINTLESVINDWIATPIARESDRASILAMFAVNLTQLLRDTERESSNALQTAIGAPPVERLVPNEEVSLVLKLLDEYQAAVQSLSFPFENHPLTLPIAFGNSLCTPGDAPPRPSCIAYDRKRELLKAQTDSSGVIASWDSTRDEAAVWTPAGKLCNALRSCLTQGRLQEISPDLLTGSLGISAARHAERASIKTLLDGLTVTELVTIIRSLAESEASTEVGDLNTKQLLYDRVMFLIGLDPTLGDSPPFVAELVKGNGSDNHFDVFLAHNSHDKDEALQLGRYLRERGIFPWIDVEQIPPGRWFQDVLQSAIRRVRCAVMLIGKSGLGKWQVIELRSFVSRCIETGMPLIPVYLPGAKSLPEELTFVRELHSVTFSDSIDEEDGIGNIVWAITGQRPKSLS